MNTDDEKLDEALDESYPASDPVAITIDHSPWDNVDAQRFEIDYEDAVAFLDYKREPGKIHLIHTEVPQELEGRGLGSMLAKYALDHARANRLHVDVSCPFVRAYIRKHLEYADLLR